MSIWWFGRKPDGRRSILSFSFPILTLLTLVVGVVTGLVLTFLARCR